MKLFFRRYGDKGSQPLIVLHGLFGISDNWVTFGRRIADEGFDVIIPDQRNHGMSPHSDVFNYLALTDDLMEMIEEQGIINPMMLGHSMGGKVAMRFALEYPEMVKRLIVVDISMKAYGDRPHHRNIIEAMQSIDLSKMKSRSEIEMQLKDRVKELRIRQFLMKNLHWRDKDTLEWRINLNGISKNLNHMFDAIQTEVTYHKPTLFIRGGQSDYILPEDYPTIRSNFPMAEIITIEGASHWVHAEAAEQFYLLSSGFLTGKPGWHQE
ncbi:MAG: alpha/beta fold hydrolase [Bacteroidales bacterium]|nr:alpha/beta fold hydrolase [Bacteroidales bacterium]